MKREKVQKHQKCYQKLQYYLTSFSLKVVQQTNFEKFKKFGIFGKHGAKVSLKSDIKY